MKFIADILYIEYAEMVEAGISDNTLRKAKSVKSPSWTFIDDPQDRRKVLIQYATLKQSYKDLLITKYGDPYLYAKNDLLLHIQANVQDTEYYLKKGFIPEDKCKNYALAAAWCRFMDAAKPKDFGYSSADQFYKACIKLYEPQKLAGFKAKNVRVLQRVLKSWREKGLDYFIHPNYLNQHSLKLGDVQKNYLRQLYSDPRKFPLTTIWAAFISECRKMGWQEVTDVCVYQYLTSPAVGMQCDTLRHGLQSWRNKYDPVISRKRASYPNDMWIGDGTPFELYYRDGNNFHKRYYVYIVLDAATWHIPGYAIGQSETTELVTQAFKNACCNNKALPHQVQVDNGSANKAAMPMIKQLTNIAFPPEVGNARAKAIEAFTAHFNRTILKFYPNHSGGNITAKREDTHANRDFLQKYKHYLPDAAACEAMIHQAIQLWGNLVRKDGTSNAQKYAVQSPRHLPLSDTLRLSVFGTMRDRSIQYTNEGILMEVAGQKTKYWVDDDDFYYKSVGKSFNIKYDPANMKCIALYEGGVLVTIAETKDLVPQAAVDFGEGDRTRLNKKLASKKQLRLTIKENNKHDAEGYLKTPISINGVFKDYLNEAESHIKQAQIAEAVISGDDVFNIYDEDLSIGGIYN
jgi:hypothetical protein